MIPNKVSVVIPSYNKGLFLAETLDSVIAQTYNFFECIIVDDGSTDNSNEIALKYCANDERIKLISQSNLGLSMARNTGIQASDGEYILPLDADDTISNTYLELAIKHFAEHPETKLVYCNADRFGDINEPWELPKYQYESIIWSNCIFCSAIYRRKDFDCTRGYNPNMKYGMEDWDFWLQLLKENDIVYQIKETLFHYRHTGNSMADQMVNQSDAMYRQLVKNHPDIYSRYYPDILVIKKSEEKCRRELDESNYELASVRSSKAYKLGKLILKPFSYFRKLVNG